MRNLSELYLRRLGPLLSPEVVQAFEEYFYAAFPISYMEFLSLANGGEPMLDCTFSYTTVFGTYTEDADQVKWFGSLTDDRETWQGIWRKTLFLRSIFSSLGRSINVIWLGESADDGTIYLDCSTSPASVYALYPECDNTAPKIASSFEDFVESLHPRC